MILVLILFLAFILRIINLNQSLWLDEALSIFAVKNYNLISLVSQYAKGDFHPPGYYIILWFWTKIFGYSEISVRLPSLIFGILTILIIYSIGKKLHSKSLGIISALLLAINPLHIYYSQETRMYSFAAFVVSLNIFFFLGLLKGKFSKLGYVLSLILVLSSDYLTYFLIPAQLLVIIFLKSKILLKKWLFLTIISLTSWTIWLPFFLSQIKNGALVSSNLPEWKQVVGSFSLKALILTFVKFIIGRISYQDDLIYTIVFLPIGLVFIYFLWNAFRSKEAKTKIVLFNWLVVPIILGWLISAIVSVYSYFRLLFVLPAFLGLISLGFLETKRNLAKFMLIFLIITQIISSLLYLFNPKFQREDWKGLVKFFKTNNSSKILLETNGNFAPLEYYSNNQIETIAALKNFPAREENDVIDLKNFLNDTKDIYLVNYLVEISDPKRLVSKQIITLGFRQTEIKDFNGVGFVYHFQR